jgi:[acyl-carrier-protein] S-malonyltransferase
MVAQGITTFVEIGPGTVLTGLIKRIAPDVRLVNLRTVEDIQSFAAESR